MSMAMLMLLVVIAAVVIVWIAVAWISAHADRKKATSRHTTFQEIARAAPAGSNLTTFESTAGVTATWVEIGPVKEVLDGRGGR